MTPASRRRHIPTHISTGDYFYFASSLRFSALLYSGFLLQGCVRSDRRTAAARVGDFASFGIIFLCAIVDLFDCARRNVTREK